MPDRLDPTERAHLIDPGDAPFEMSGLPVSAELSDLARRFWIPVWRVAESAGSTQRVLQYPVCLLVIANDYQRFYGVTSGLSETTLHGRGWAVGLMLQPAAGMLLAGRPVDQLTDSFVDLGTLDRLDGARLAAAVRERMDPDPADPDAQRCAASLVERALLPHREVDEEGLLVNRIVALVEDDPDLRRAGELCERFGPHERALQRLLMRRVGMGPLWLIRRRRLHEATERLRQAEVSLAELAAELGYADQAHFTTDYRRATGLTPGQFSRRFQT